MELWKLFVIVAFITVSSIHSISIPVNTSTAYPKEGTEKVIITKPIEQRDDDRTDDWSIGETSLENTKDEDVKFYIYTSSRMEMTEIKINDRASLEGANNFVFGKPVLMMIHGFLGSCDGDNFPGLLVQAYFGQGKTENLLCTDWPQLAFHGTSLSVSTSITAYRESIENGVKVGKQLADFVRFLVNTEAIQSPNDIHIIGFSMGAHIAASAASSLQKNFSKKIGRITGLDAAAPVYTFYPLDKVLDVTDADFVDAYHTNSGKLGMKNRIGHLDFYINGGGSQPECRNTGVAKIDRMEPITGICSHQMVPQYYAGSISNSTPVRGCTAAGWKGKQAESSCIELIPFGENCVIGSSGEYYVFIPAKISSYIWLPDVDFK